MNDFPLQTPEYNLAEEIPFGNRIHYWNKFRQQWSSTEIFAPLTRLIASPAPCSPSRPLFDALSGALTMIVQLMWNPQCKICNVESTSVKCETRVSLTRNPY